MICSYALWPLALVMGVNVEDCRRVAQLIGTKTFLNEFIAFMQLGDLLTNRKALDAHVIKNGTWYWRGDDIVMTSSAAEDIILKDGIISVSHRLRISYPSLLLIFSSPTDSNK
jgi:pyrimidine nucleoside transport protein